jgi:hypothetical protein
MAKKSFPYGPFHRIRSRTQSDAVARQIIASGELWGKTPFGGDSPQVEAYLGPLPYDKPGIEFHSAVEPYPNKHPFHVRWRLEQEGVRFEDDHAKIDIAVTKCTQIV